MIRIIVSVSSILLFAGTVFANEPDSRTGKPEGDKVVSGMSIVGNDEAPKSLVIVPWKSSDLGETQGVAAGLDGGRDPIDREVFARALDFFELRTGSRE